MSIRKCLLVGDGGTGKTSLIKRLVTGEFTNTYSATIGYEVHCLTIRPVKSSAHRFALHVWDVSGQSASSSLMREILSGADCAIILFEVTSRITFKNVWIWYRDVVNVCGPEIPIVVLGNKIDMPGRKLKTESLPKRLLSSVKYYDISVKMRKNIEEPIQWLAGQLLKASQSDIIIERPSASMDPVISKRDFINENEDENELRNPPHPQEVMGKNVKKKSRASTRSQTATRFERS